MLDKSSVRTFLAPEGSISVLLKRAAAGFILRFGGLGILSNKRPDGSYWPSGHCLRALPRNAKIKSEKPYFSAFVSHETEAERFKK